MDRRKIGDLAEEKIKKFLEREGYEFLAKNFYSKNGEIDIIVKKGSMIVFVEVKYRSCNKFGYGEEAVDSGKRKRIYLSAMEYLNHNKLNDYNYRFDIVSLMGEKITWIKNSIWGDEIGF